MVKKSRKDHSRSRSRDRNRHSKRSRSRSHSKKSKRSRSKSRDRDRDRKKRSNSRDKARDRHRDRKRSRSRSHSRSKRVRSKSREETRRRRDRSRTRSRSSRRDYSSTRKRERSPELTPEERDQRTVFCMQLSARIRPRDLEEFFSQVGKVRDVRLITDPRTKKSKGIAYIEFKDIESVALVDKIFNKFKLRKIKLSILSYLGYCINWSALTWSSYNC
jgi:RNA-binding protein 23/39